MRVLSHGSSIEEAHGGEKVEDAEPDEEDHPAGLLTLPEVILLTGMRASQPFIGHFSGNMAGTRGHEMRTIEGVLLAETGRLQSRFDRGPSEFAQLHAVWMRNVRWRGRSARRSAVTCPCSRPAFPTPGGRWAWPRRQE